MVSPFSLARNKAKFAEDRLKFEPGADPGPGEEEGMRARQIELTPSGFQCVERGNRLDGKSDVLGVPLTGSFRD